MYQIDLLGEHQELYLLYKVSAQEVVPRCHNMGKDMTGVLLVHQGLVFEPKCIFAMPLKGR